MDSVGHRHREQAAARLAEPLKTTTRDEVRSTTASRRSGIVKNQLSELKNRIDALARLPVNWNSYDAEPPNDAAVKSALSVLEMASTLGALPDRADASAENGIVLSFANGNRYSDIECYNSGEVFGAMHDRPHEPHVWNIGCGKQEIRAALNSIREFIHA